MSLDLPESTSYLRIPSLCREHPLLLERPGKWSHISKNSRSVHFGRLEGGASGFRLVSELLRKRFSSEEIIRWQSGCQASVPGMPPASLLRPFLAVAGSDESN